jgi:hypothetical protein
MIIGGVDYHPSVQQVAFLDTQTGETGESRFWGIVLKGGSSKIS